MQFVWAGDRQAVNQQKNFYITLEKQVDRLEICAVDNYQVCVDGKFLAYGPERTAAGYSRKKILFLDKASFIEIKVIAHGVPTYMCDFQPPFFGAALYNGDKLVYTSKDFSCRVDLLRDEKVCRYSRQRGFIEKQLLADAQYAELEPYAVESPIILNGIGDTANYQIIPFEKLQESDFNGFDIVTKPWWEDIPEYVTPDGHYSIEKDFLTPKTGYKEILFTLPVVKTGFLQVEVKSGETGEFFIVFDEILNDGKWNFRRSDCNDLFIYGYEKGNFSHLSAEPYTMKYIKVIYKGEVNVTPSMVLYENSKFNFPYTGDKKIQSIIEAAKNTFAQNAVDIFTDCAGRERAGWLCDAYFTAKAERFFTGENKIERNYLENFILANTEELPKGMLPMCFPSQHDVGSFIPNWAMWYVVELKDYFDRTQDRELIDRAKEKVYGVIEYFETFKNVYGLIENLQSWIFVEHSIANSLDYVKGVNFPSNMLYSAMLKCAGELYCDNELLAQAEFVKTQVVKYSFNGTFFVDNAEIVNGEMVPFADHISETCQYYALFFHVYENEDFAILMQETFGPNRKDGFEYVGKSNVFIGDYLRLFWLYERKEYGRILNEAIEYFYEMSQKTGTLWEHDLAKASCNHGFAAVIAMLLFNALNKM
ncbi:MAG: hypothetical protein IJD77_06075 [Clostridia bacterium]|nr:hypothetical protein [Clostridia bacterium]